MRRGLSLQRQSCQSGSGYLFSSRSSRRYIRS